MPTPRDVGAVGVGEETNNRSFPSSCLWKTSVEQVGLEKSRLGRHLFPKREPQQSWGHSERTVRRLFPLAGAVAPRCCACYMQWYLLRTQPSTQRGVESAGAGQCVGDKGTGKRGILKAVRGSAWRLRPQVLCPFSTCVQWHSLPTADTADFRGGWAWGELWAHKPCCIPACPPPNCWEHRGGPRGQTAPQAGPSGPVQASW